MKKFFQQLLNDLHVDTQTSQQKSGDPHTLELAASVILLETAAMDNEIAQTERALIMDILREHFHLNPNEVSELLNAASDARQQAIDLHQFTQIINDTCSKTQKIRLMTYIWQVIYADGRLDKHEDYLVHKLARLMHVDHKEFIEAKLKARNNKDISRSEDNSANSPPDTQAGSSSR
ncbi:TerB family tellurite resistance protein [bacterium]|nr:TerB family tellurite resistance protein [candidate division CSSED10-310 bacterium]